MGGDGEKEMEARVGMFDNNFFLIHPVHQDQTENTPRCDPHLMSDRVSQCGPDGQGACV